MFKTFNNVANSLQNTLLDAMLKIDKKYDKEKIENNMLIAFQYAYVHANSDDEESIRNYLQKTIDEDLGASPLGHFFRGSFTVDNVMDMIENISDEQKENLHLSRENYQEYRIKTNWEESFYNEDASPT